MIVSRASSFRSRRCAVKSMQLCTPVRRNYFNISEMFPKSTAAGKYTNIVKSDCKSHDLLQAYGLILKASPGTYCMTPDMARCLDKLHRVIEIEMSSIGAQKVFLPCLAPRNIWEESGRWQEMGSELLKVTDRHDKDNCLAPTHEEAITSLISSFMISHKNLPVKWYQIGRKFRDEARPKHGLLRCREFEMKDLYCFDKDEAHAQLTYDEVTGAYHRIYKRLALDVESVAASSGAMGGSQSNEFHLVSDIGEDTLIKCHSCGQNYNKELVDVDKSSSNTFFCASCKKESEFESLTAIEISHSFLLGTRYSKQFNAHYISSEGKKIPYYMSCYGIGITRLLAAAVEVLSEPNEIRWPTVLAPYQIFVIPQKKGHQFDETLELSRQVCSSLEQFSHLTNEVVLDDRFDMSIGKRISEARALGIPHIIAVGKQSLLETPKYEYLDVYNEKSNYLTLSELMGLLSVLDTVVLNGGSRQIAMGDAQMQHFGP